MSVISSLLSRLRVAEPPSVEEEPLPPLDPAAVRHRMMPPELREAVWPAPVSAQTQSYVLPLRSSPPSMASLPWQGEIADAEWKPVVLSELEMSAIPTIPSLDELAEEGGISPDEPRFPFDT